MSSIGAAQSAMSQAAQSFATSATTLRAVLEGTVDKDAHVHAKQMIQARDAWMAQIRSAKIADDLMREIMAMRAQEPAQR